MEEQSTARFQVKQRTTVHKTKRASVVEIQRRVTLTRKLVTVNIALWIGPELFQ